MSKTVFLKNAVGASTEYTVENGVKLSDGNGGFATFSANGGNVERAISSSHVLSAQDYTTAADVKAALETESVSVSIPAGNTVIGTYGHSIVMGWVGNEDKMVYADVLMPINPSVFGVNITQTQNQDGSTTVTCTYSDNSDVPSFMAAAPRGRMCVQVYLEVIYTPD